MRGDLNPPSSLGRRRLLAGVAGGLLGSLLLPRRGAALQANTALQAGSAQQAGVIPLNDRLSLVTSGGTNVLALSSADGLVLVDSGAPELSDRLMASLQQRFPGGRVRTVFNTHWHPENTGANDVLRERGATIIAHENTRLWMATPTWIPAEDRYRRPRSRPAHPTETFYIDGSMDGEGTRIDYGYLADAHTSGDIYVFFRDANVLAVGDVASPARDPELDYLTGAWIGGRVDAIDRLLARSDDHTRIVPGYGPVMSRAELQAEHEMMKTIYERTVERVRQGDYVEDMLTAGVMNGLARTWSDPRKFLYAVHKGLWAHHNKLSPDVV
jgi:glyoxylase-like metal-dependent hydrolase (beta-lactamase superfamily II)